MNILRPLPLRNGRDNHDDDSHVAHCTRVDRGKLLITLSRCPAARLINRGYVRTILENVEGSRKVSRCRLPVIGQVHRGVEKVLEVA